MAQVLAAIHTNGLGARVRSILLHPCFAIGILGLELAFAVHIYVMVPSRELLPDLATYLKAAEALHRGEDIYQHPYEVEFAKGAMFRLRYLYPPLLAHTLSKFLFLDRGTLFFCWNALSLLAICGSVVSTALVLGHSWWRRFPLTKRIVFLGFFTICFEPLCSGVRHGQVSAFVLLLLSLFLLSSLTKHDVIAGIALACAIQLKMTPAVLLFAPLLFGRWKTILWCSIASACFVLLTVADTGSPEVFRNFIFSVSSTEDNFVLRTNSFNFRVDRSVLSMVGLFEDRSARLIIKLLILFVVVLGAVAIRLRGEENYLTAISFLIVGMIFASPIIWDHHLTWLLPCLAVMTMTAARNEQERLKVLTLSLGAMFCLTKVYLIHFTVYHSAPYLLEISALIPCGILMAMGIFLMRSTVEVVKGKC